MQKNQDAVLKNKRKIPNKSNIPKAQVAPRYFSVMLKTVDIDSQAWHRLTDPLINHYKLHMETPEAAVLEIKEVHEKSYHEYANYLLEFIHAAHDGEIDLLLEDPLSYDEWKNLDGPNHPHFPDETHADA